MSPRATNRWFAGCALLLGTTALFGLPACGAAPGHAAAVRTVLTRGHLHSGKPWQLTAFEKGSQLGLELDAPSGSSYSGAVGFNGSLGGRYFVAGHGPGNSVFYYGPVPASAVKVRLTSPGYRPIVLATSPIPQRNNLPRGRFFIVHPPGPAFMSWTVTPLDASNHKVSFQTF